MAGQVEQLREAYEALGLPRHPKKAVQRSSVGEMQGALLDGERGFAMAKPAKVVQYCRLGFELLQRGQSTLRELQVVCGGFVYLCMFRRALLCSLNAVFEHMRAFESEAPVVRLSLPYQVKVEIARFILLAPLAQMEFRAKVDGEVTCSDASSYGGGLCASKGLSELVMRRSTPVVGATFQRNMTLCRCSVLGCLMESVPCALRATCWACQWPGM